MGVKRTLQYLTHPYSGKPTAVSTALFANPTVTNPSQDDPLNARHRPHAPTSTPTATPHSTDNISLEKESGMDVSMDEIEQRAMPAYKANLDLDRERDS